MRPFKIEASEKTQTITLNILDAPKEAALVLTVEEACHVGFKLIRMAGMVDGMNELKAAILRDAAAKAAASR